MKFPGVSPLALASTAIFAVTALIAAATGIAAAKWAENRYFPVLKDWAPTSVQTVGEDLLVAGTQVKGRSCRYIPPIRAETSDGRHLVVESRATTSGQNWPPSLLPRQFGPWLIRGGAKQSVHLYAEHECHQGWRTFSALGRVDAP